MLNKGPCIRDLQLAERFFRRGADVSRALFIAVAPGRRDNTCVTLRFDRQISQL